MSEAALNQRPLGELLEHRQKMIILNSLLLAMFISALDSSIVATATPRILADLGGFKLLSWVFTVYLLASTTAVPIAGKLSDMFGRKPFILAGLAVFVGASAACGAAPSMLFLIIARCVQGIGGGILFGTTMSAIGDIFTPMERAKYMGLMMGAFTLAGLAGPTVGGFLTDGPGWRWCFFINLPIGAAAAALVWTNLPNRAMGGRLSSIDFLGALLLGGSTVAILLGLVWANQAFGWGAPETVGLFAGGAGLAVLFVLQERRHPYAILPTHLFRNRPFVQLNVMAALQGAALFGAIQYLPTFIQTSLGASATSSGLVSTPQSIGVLIAAIVGGQVVARTGTFKVQVIVGCCMTCAATFLLQTLDPSVPEWHIVVFMALMGLGGGLVGPTLSVIIQSTVPHRYMGVATSGRQFFMQIGQVMGVAVFGLIFTTSYTGSFGDSLPNDARAAISRETYARFQDPTLALDPKGFEDVRQSILALPDGARLLDETVSTQRDAVGTAIDRLFLGSLGVMLVILVLAFALPEIPLRRTLSSREATDEPLPGVELPVLEL